MLILRFAHFLCAAQEMSRAVRPVFSGVFRHRHHRLWRGGFVVKKRDALTDPGHARDVVGGVAGERQQISQLIDAHSEALFDLALLGVHLSRMGEEIVLWSTEEFGFCTLDDAYATGSSMLPQKKNPDVAELARGKTGRLIGHLTAVLVTLGQTAVRPTAG